MHELTKIIKSIIKETGPITFDKFMGLALYHKKYGYYTAGKRIIGKEGDYYTSPCVHPAFGEVISSLIHKSYEVIGVSNFTIVEMGAGKGYLALDILDSTKRNYPNLYNCLNYTIIEKSPHQILQEKNLLKEHLDKIKWINRISELKSTNICGIFISNELLDSFPFHRARFEDGMLKEIFVDLKNDEFIEVIDDPSIKELRDYFLDYNIDFKDCQEVEINLHAEKWLRDIASVLDKGFVMTIDYGFLAQELFNPTRLKGTCKCLYKHSINDNPYINIGKQDITAHVDFSNLIRIEESVGLKTLKYTTQGQFLIDWGILDIIERTTENNKQSEATRLKTIFSIKNLFLPEQMGDRFKILIQGRNVGEIINSLIPKSPFRISLQTDTDIIDLN